MHCYSEKTAAFWLELEFSVGLKEGFDANKPLGTGEKQKEDISAQDTAL